MTTQFLKLPVKCKIVMCTTTSVYSPNSKVTEGDVALDLTQLKEGYKYVFYLVEKSSKCSFLGEGMLLGYIEDSTGALVDYSFIWSEAVRLKTRLVPLVDEITDEDKKYFVAMPMVVGTAPKQFDEEEMTDDEIIEFLDTMEELGVCEPEVDEVEETDEDEE